MDDPFDERDVTVQAGVGPAGLEMSRYDEVADENPRHAEVETEAGGDLSHRHGFAAQRDDLARLEPVPGKRGLTVGRRDDLGLYLKRHRGWLGPSAGDEVWADTLCRLWFRFRRQRLGRGRQLADERAHHGLAFVGRHLSTRRSP